MKIDTRIIRSGFDGKQCLVHARMCETPERMLATAQYLNIAGDDFFSGLLAAQSFDGGATWTEFIPQAGLAPIREGDRVVVCCDATPLYHKKTGKILLTGHTAEYEQGDLRPAAFYHARTPYSVFDTEKGEFAPMQMLLMPEGAPACGNGCGQPLELDNGDVLLPVYYRKQGENHFRSLVLRCAFDGETLSVLEWGNEMTVEIERGLSEPSLAVHEGVYYMTLRNDECAMVARSEDGLHYTDLQLWRWEDGSILQSYNTQQHWMQADGELWLVYTRRGADNDHIPRHRAPLFGAKVENMRLVKETEIALTPQRGARMGNFGVTTLLDGRAAVMVAEWMQPVGCEKYGSDNAIFMTTVGG